MTITGKIELKEPYKTDWKYDYVVINKEPRRNVILYNSHKSRSTVSYARYLYETSKGYYLDKNLVIDHIDGNPLNDVLDNFQVLTVGDNNIKRFRQTNTTRKMVTLKCGVCGNVFTKPKNNTHLTIKTRKSTYCSKPCSGKHTNPSEILKEFRTG